MNYAPRLSMFKRDKYLFIGIHAGLSTGELGVLLVLLATEKGEIAHRSTLWTELRRFCGDEVNAGPLLPWSRQGVCKAIEALTRRGWVQDIPSGWGSERDLGLRLLPIVIEAAMPKWLPRLLVPAGPESATSVAPPPAPATPKARRASGLFPVEKALSRVSRDLVATAAKRMGRRKPDVSESEKFVLDLVRTKPGISINECGKHVRMKFGRQLAYPLLKAAYQAAQGERRKRGGK